MAPPKKRGEKIDLSLKMSVTSCDWSTLGDDEEVEANSALDLQKIRQNLPAAPKASRNEELLSKIPNEGPFTALLQNLPFSSRETDVISFLGDIPFKDMMMDKNSSNNQFSGRVSLSLHNKEDLGKLLELHGSYLVGRPVRVELFDHTKSFISRSGYSSRIRGSGNELPSFGGEGNWRSNIMSNNMSANGYNNDDNCSDWRRQGPMPTGNDARYDNTGRKTFETTSHIDPDCKDWRSQSGVSHQSRQEDSSGPWRSNFKRPENDFLSNSSQSDNWRSSQPGPPSSQQTQNYRSTSMIGKDGGFSGNRFADSTSNAPWQRDSSEAFRSEGPESSVPSDGGNWRSNITRREMGFANSGIGNSVNRGLNSKTDVISTTQQQESSGSSELYKRAPPPPVNAWAKKLWFGNERAENIDISSKSSVIIPKECLPVND